MVFYKKSGKKTNKENKENKENLLNGYEMPQKKLFIKYTNKIRNFFGFKCPCCYDIYHEDMTIHNCHNNKKYMLLESV